MEVKNIIITSDRETTLVYCLTLTVDEVKKFAEYSKINVNDAFEVKDEELHYYCIDGRFYADTEAKENRIRKLISK